MYIYIEIYSYVSSTTWTEVRLSPLPRPHPPVAARCQLPPTQSLKFERPGRPGDRKEEGRKGRVYLLNIYRISVNWDLFSDLFSDRELLVKYLWTILWDMCEIDGSHQLKWWFMRLQWATGRDHFFGGRQDGQGGLVFVQWA